MAKESHDQIRSFIVCLLALCALAVATPSFAELGRTPGSADVSNSGSFNYSIPIFTPTGPHGLQPSVALTYDSNGGGGVLGRGWSLSGEFNSSIRTCRSTIAQDGDAGNVYKFCLDGNRLRVQGGLSYYATPYSEYFTEVADFSHIRLATNENGIYWVVRRKDNLTYYYGSGTGAAIYGSAGYEWKLSEIQDRAGNRVVFTWKTPDGTTAGTSHLTKIQWTQTSAHSGSFVYSTDFIYTAGGNSANSSYYISKPGIAEAFDYDRLDAITVSTSGTVKHKYLLTYGTSSTTAGQRLEYVQECSNSAGTDCLSGTTITYNGALGLDSVGTGLYGAGDHDFNGDGFKDLIYGDGTWRVRLGSAGGYGSPINTYAAVGSYLVGKLTEAPGEQLLVEASGAWRVYYWNVSSFGSEATSLTTTDVPANVVLADVNADGRDDLVYSACGGGCTVNDSYGTVTLTVRLNTSYNLSPTFADPPISRSYVFGYDPPGWAESMPLYYTVDGSTITITATLSKGGDSDGDGREELNVHLDWTWCHLNYYYGCVSDPYLSAYSHNGVAWFDVDMDAFIADSAGAFLTEADFNGDGCDDFLTSGGVGLSGCSSPGVVASVVTDSSGSGSYAGFADWNGDGRDDYFLADGTNLYVRPFVGNTMGSVVDTGLDSCTIWRADGNGDGLDDIMCGDEVYYRTGGVPDLVAGIEDGFGVTYTPTYSSIAVASSHTPTTDAAYPYRDMHGGLRVVTSLTASDGVGGTYHTDYHYHGARMNMYGRGFVGFSKIDSTDSRNSIKHQQEFERAFPYSGSLKAERFYRPGGSTLISEKILTMSSAALDSTSHNERVFRYTSALAEDVYEVNVGGANDGQWITHTAVSNTYDYPTGNLTASTRTVTDHDPYSPNVNNSWTEATSITFETNADRTTYWCLHLPIASSVTYSTWGLSSITRSKSFTPDYGNCRVIAESIEPSSSTLRVDSVYLYDAFDNLYQVQITGRDQNGDNMGTRYTTTTWGTTGQFPESMTNAAGHTTTRTFHSTFGSVLTETDPNNIVVATNTYDNFGRLSRSTRPDGTYTEITRIGCAAWSVCENGAPATGGALDKYLEIHEERDSSNNLIRDSQYHFDKLGRLILQFNRLRNSNYNRIGREYDAMGRLYREQAPAMQYSSTVYWTTNTYDLLGRLSSQSHPFSDSDDAPVTTNFGYAGLTQTITDAKGKVTTKVMDVNGWMRQSRDHDGYGQNFSYDAAGSLTAVTDTLSNNLFSATYSYGAKPFQITTADMDLGNGWSYTYNSLGELVEWEDANTNTFSQTYDALSRVTSRTESEGTTTWTWGTSDASHNIGQLYSVAMTNYGEVLGYDSLGRPSARSITADSNTYNFNYTYNSQGQLDTLTFPTSTLDPRVKVKYGYLNGYMQTITDWTSGSAGTTYWIGNYMNVRGQTSWETLGNGVVTERDFDAVTGQLNSIQSAYGGGVALQNLGYQYDAAGNVTLRQENTQGLTENFYYDDNLHRLTSSQLNSNTPVTYTYNAMGNITSRSDVNGGAAWSYDGTRKHALVGIAAGGGQGAISYEYDNNNSNRNGNMTKRAGATIGWTSYNYPEYLSTATEDTYFTYGPDRQYYKQDYTGPGVSETTYYIGGLLEKVDNGSTVDWRHYIMAEGQTVAIVSRKSGASSATTVNYPLEDNQGGGATLTNSGGSLLVRESFNAFGLQRDGDDWDGAESSGDLTTIEGISRRGYTGHSMLGRMGLIHMNGRVQDAFTGRFLSPDPTIPNPGFTQSYNRYAYVNNNPASYFDPSGFSCATILVQCGGDVVNGRIGECSIANLADCDYLDVRRLIKYIGFMCGLLGPNCGVAMEAAGTSSEELSSEGKKKSERQFQAKQPKQSPQSQACIGAPKDCGGWNFWRDNAVGGFLSHLADPFALFNDGVNPLSKNWLTYGEQDDARIAAAVSFFPAAGALGAEARVGGTWAQGTFDSLWGSIDYHFGKHGAGRTLEQYTDDASRFFERNRGQAEWGRWNSKWDESYRLKLGDQGGYFTRDGNILTYWD